MFFGCRKIYSSADVVVVFVLRELRIFLISLCLPVFCVYLLVDKINNHTKLCKEQLPVERKFMSRKFSEIGDLEIRKF